MYRLTSEWTLSLNHIAVKWNYARPDGGWPEKLLHAVGLSDLLEKWPERIVPLGRGEGTLERAQPRTSVCVPEFQSHREGLMLISECWAWGQRVTATLPLF